MTSAVALDRREDDRMALDAATMAEWPPQRDQPVLRVGAEREDRDVFEGSGFTQVTRLNPADKPELSAGPQPCLAIDGNGAIGLDR